ncbi:hypothetical protein [Kitasatospora sp. NPDC008115]|uniref:hypothetical protein n=1 Tax=Kitasatospora sp. NPDC008115 TaxID=3364022 RepID=UPI0036E91A6D
MDEHPGPDRTDIRTYGDNSWSIGHVYRSTFNFLKKLDSWPLVAPLPLLLAVGTAGYAALSWPGGPQSQYLWFYAALGPGFVLSVKCAVTGSVGASRKWPRTGLLVLASALVLSLLGLAGLENVRRNGEIPVDVSVRGTGPLTATGPQTLVLPAQAPGKARDRLRLALTIADDDPAAPTCVHRTTATLTVLTPGVTPGVQQVPAQSVVEFDLGGQRGEVVVELSLQTRQNCVMRVAKADGTLFNN